MFPNDVLAGFYSNIIDEFRKECLAIRMKGKLNSAHVINAPTGLFIIRGVPTYIRSNNGPEFIAEAGQAMDQGHRRRGRLYRPWIPWENGYCESFNARFRDKRLNREKFYTLKEAQIVIEHWPKH